MQRYLLLGWTSLLLATGSGCSPWHTEEYDARLASAEDNAATARLRADQWRRLTWELMGLTPGRPDGPAVIERRNATSRGTG